MLKEADSMSIGELEEFLRELPPELKHLPVKVQDTTGIRPIAVKNISFADNEKYYSLQSLKGRTTFAGIYLELYGE